MALKLWLPLNGDLHNQGLDDVTITNNGATVNNAGKIGKCYSFNGSNNKIIGALSTPITSSIGSLSCWFKINSLPSSSGFYNLIQLGNLGGYATCLLGIYLEYNTRITVSINGSSTNSNSYTHSLENNKWYHICATFNGEIVKLFLNGEEVLSKSATVGSYATASYLYCGGTSSYYLNGYLNDIKYFDHCLSLKEVKELSKGLILHYSLNDNSVQVLDNCYNYPTFETTSVGGGWNHWGGTGHKGHYGQNTDKNYIFRKNQTYSQWVSNDEDATANYLLYQSPAFDGGVRSLQCICKEENGLKINESIVYPDWNARDGGAQLHKWTHIIPLGNGFYHCKCEGIQQSGSNDLVGFYVSAGYKVYFSEAYLENDKSICSDIFFPSNVVYDASGYQRNGTANNITCSSDAPRYNTSSIFNGTNSYIKVNSNDWMAQGIEEATINIWGYMDDWTNWGGRRLFSCTESGGFNLELLDSRMKMAISVYTNAAKTSNAYIPTVDRISIDYKALSSGWHMFTCVYTTSGCKFYVDGVLEDEKEYTSYGIHYYTNARLFLGCEANSANPSSPYFNGKMSDFRIYYTALDDLDILALYRTPISITNSGVLMTQSEISEV